MGRVNDTPASEPAAQSATEPESGAGSSALVEPLPHVAAAVFGARLARAEQFAALLVSDGVLRGLIGPREPNRIWSRHLLNCAVLADLFPEQTRVVDVGSGAGLPGIILAIRRPDLRVDLVEPLQRRVEFLHEAVDQLGLVDQVRVIRGRATDPAVVATVGAAPWVTARAVAPLDRLVEWCLPLAGAGGHLAFIKGAHAADEIERSRRTLSRPGAANARVVTCGGGVLGDETAVVVLDAISTGRRQARAQRRATR